MFLEFVYSVFFLSFGWRSIMSFISLDNKILLVFHYGPPGTQPETNNLAMDAKGVFCEREQ